MSDAVPTIEMLEAAAIPVPDGFQVLTPEQIATLAPIFLAQGAELPNPAVSTFVGHVKDGEVLAFIVLQIKLHAEPMWIKEGHSELLTGLVKKAEEVILKRAGPQWVYLFTPAGRVTQLAVSMGCKMEPWVVCSKFVQPEVPAQPVVDLMPEVSEPEVHTDEPAQTETVN